MQTFNFYRDQKCTIWERGSFEIEADSYEEALKIVKELEEKKRSYNDLDVRYEFLYETSEELKPEENGYESTIEIFSEDNNETIYTNNPRLPKP